MVEVPGRIPPDRAAPRLERRRISPGGGGAQRRVPPGRQRDAAWGGSRPQAAAAGDGSRQGGSGRSCRGERIFVGDDGDGVES